jgi:uncharacterized damage-inducible protein DinB
MARTNQAPGDVGLATLARTLAAYNRWMNGKLYAVVAAMPDDERKADRGAFFGSVHGTLNHLLLADRVWMGRFTREPYSVTGLDQELYADFAELARERAAEDTRIEAWAAGLSDAALIGKLRYRTIANPAERTSDLWLCVFHFFNHQTHHRGQLTTLLAQSGRDYGVTDLMWMPSPDSAS